VVTSLILILGLAAGVALLLRRWKGSVGRREGPLRLLHVIALGSRERLALVKVGGRYLVVGITPTSVNRIAELEDIQAVPPEGVTGGAPPGPP
jgi:flagellar protein FliO/FliZ